MKTAIISMLALVAVTAFGSYYQSVVVPYVVVGSVCAIAILVAQGKIKPREYPIYIYGISLALLWKTSMLGHYIVGTDIQGEFFMVNRAIEQGWDLSYAHPYNTSLVLGGLSPLLAKIGIPVLWQFKALYPAVFACVPLLLYFAYRKMMGEKRAFWASLFFMFMASFFVEVVGIVKSMVAEAFLALAVLFFMLDLKAWQKALGVGLSVILASLCHYTIGIIAMVYLAGGFLLLLFGKVIRLGIWRKVRMSVFASLGCVVIAVFVGNFLWFGNVDGGSILKVYKEVGVSMAQTIVGYFDFGDTDKVDNPVNPTNPGGSANGDNNSSGNDADVNVPPASPPAVPETPSKPFYLNAQEPLIKTAIGLDFKEASVGGKMFRIVQCLTELLLLAGAVYLMFRHRKYKFTAEFVSFVWVSFVILGLCIFWLGFSSLLNASRFYQISLFFLAPMLVVGVEELAFDIGRGARWLKRPQ